MQLVVPLRHELGRLEAAGVEVHKTGMEYLMEGETGEYVKELQRFLTQTGHYRYKDGVTGFYGPVTTNAVKKWQHKHGGALKCVCGTTQTFCYSAQRQLNS
jgi:hypothetical protein